MTATERPINLAPLERANARLGEFIAVYSGTSDDHPHHEPLGAAVVKSFEFTYELAFSAIRRYVADYVLSPGQVGQMRIPDIIRAAGKNGLIESLEDWLVFRHRRNSTAHEYFDENTINQIIDVAPNFHNAVSALLKALQDRTDDNTAFSS